jgi:hypothetical protein
LNATDVRQLNLDRVTYNFPYSFNCPFARLTHLRLSDTRATNPRHTFITTLSFPSLTHLSTRALSVDRTDHHLNPHHSFGLDRLAPQLELLVLDGALSNLAQALVDHASRMTTLRTLKVACPEVLSASELARVLSRLPHSPRTLDVGSLPCSASLARAVANSLERDRASVRDLEVVRVPNWRVVEVASWRGPAKLEFTRLVRLATERGVKVELV